MRVMLDTNVILSLASMRRTALGSMSKENVCRACASTGV